MNHADWNIAALAVVALINLYVAVVARRTEKNTNSMKDALVASTRKEALFEGHAEGLAAGRDEQRNNPNRPV